MVHETVTLSHCQISMRSRWHSGKPLCTLFGEEEGVEGHILAQQKMFSQGLKENE